MQSGVFQAGGDELEQIVRDVAVVILNKYGAARITTFIGERQLRDVIASMFQVNSFHYWSPVEFADHCDILLSESFKRPPSSEDAAMAKQLRIAAAALTLVPEELWTEHTHRANLAMLEQAEGAGNKKWKRTLYHYLRWALLGGLSGPAIPKVIEILGRRICIERIQSAAQEMKNLETMATKPNITTDAPRFLGTSFESVKGKAAAHG